MAQLQGIKVKLVAKDYSHEEGIDFDETFAQVSNYNLSGIFSSCHVKNTFLNGEPEEEVYVCQLPGFEDSKFP